MNAMTDLAEKGCNDLFTAQAELVKSIFPFPPRAL
jgi:hypothetical protein